MIEAIKDDLGYLKLHRAAEVFAGLADGPQRDDRLKFLAALAAEEAAATRQRRLNARLRFAHFPARRTIEEFDFEFQPSIDPNVIGDLAELSFVEVGTPILFLGKPGCGKSHLAIALGIRAVEAGYRGYFTTATDMVAAMTTAYADGSFPRRSAPTPARPSW
jgi:DNA replication protein DnaC